MSTRWRIQLLGKLRAENDERILTRFRTQKAAGLFAYLAYYPRKSHAREALMEWLWPDVSPEVGRNRLSTALSHLRSPLEPPPLPAGTVLIADRIGIRINPDAIHTDVEDFQTALRTANKAENVPAKIEALSRALGLYQGELLPELYDDWVVQERQQLSAQFDKASRQLIAHWKSAGQPERALECARRLVMLDATNAGAQEEVIRLYLATDQDSVALRQYQLYARQLALQDEKPPAALRDLFEEKEIRETRDEIREDTQSKIQNLKSKIVPSYLLPPTSLPSGFVALLLTDIERSTPQWVANEAQYPAALAGHHAVLRRAFREYGGQEVKEVGDGFIVAFEDMRHALACAMGAQRALDGHAWPTGIAAPRVRMALHTGNMEWHEGDYRGLALNHAARILGAAHGGQILCSEAAALLAQGSPDGLPQDMELKSLGAYRVRDFPASQQLFQVNYPAMPQMEFAPPHAPRGHADALPSTLTRFVGRERELARLQALLSPVSVGDAAPPYRLITLTGIGGTGKTRLALEIARLEGERLEGAVWHVPLADARRVQDVESALRQQLRLPYAPTASLPEQAGELLSRQPSLLILDNFEQLLPVQEEEVAVPPAVALVAMLLERVPTLTVLVTSRRLLRLSGEREFVVPPLQTPQLAPPAAGLNAAFLNEVSRCESARLFVERAQDARPDFQLTLNNADAVAALCDRLEGIPLAIVLAAARAQVMSPRQMLAQLENRFQFLVSRNRDAGARHKTLRAAMDWSYALLTPELQAFLAQLSVFLGGWTWEAAEAVCRQPLALDYLEQLRDASLLLAEEQAEGEQIRFRLLATLRDYAREQLSEQEREGLRQEHYSYYLRMAEQSELELTGPHQAEWLNRLESEHDNFRVALRRATNDQARLRLAGALYRFWERRDYFQEGRAWLDTAETAVNVDPSTQAKALNGAGVLAAAQGDNAVAERLLEQSLALQQTLGDRRGIATALNNLGMAQRNLGRYDAAHYSYAQALDLCRTLEEGAMTAKTLNNMGILAVDKEDFVTAQSHFEASLQMARRLGDEMQIAAVLMGLGGIAQRQEDYAQAQACYEESQTLLRKLGKKWSLARTLFNLAIILYLKEGYAQAWPHFVESLMQMQEVGDHSGVPDALETMSEVLQEQEAWTPAACLLASAGSLQEKMLVTPPPAQCAARESMIVALQVQLPEPQFQIVWKQGRAMTEKEVFAYIRTIDCAS